MLTNTLLLVARPALVDEVWAISTHQLLTEQLAGKHNIPRERMFLVLNGVSPPQVDNSPRASSMPPRASTCGSSSAGRSRPCCGPYRWTRRAQRAEQGAVAADLTGDQRRVPARHSRAGRFLVSRRGEQKVDPSANKRTLNLGLVKVRL
jgi:hypothetical protein